MVSLSTDLTLLWSIVGTSFSWSAVGLRRSRFDLPHLRRLPGKVPIHRLGSQQHDSPARVGASRDTCKFTPNRPLQRKLQFREPKTKGSPWDESFSLFSLTNPLQCSHKTERPPDLWIGPPLLASHFLAPPLPPTFLAQRKCSLLVDPTSSPVHPFLLVGRSVGVSQNKDLKLVGFLSADACFSCINRGLVTQVFRTRR